MTKKEAKFNEIYKDCRVLVLEIIRKNTTNDQDVQDISQQVWLRFWLKLLSDRLDFTLSVKAYLHQIAKHLCFDYHRIRTRTLKGSTLSLDSKIGDNSELGDITGEDDIDSFEMKDQKEVLLAEIDQYLPKVRSNALHARSTGAKYEEMAKGVIMGTFKTNLHRGRVELKKKSVVYQELIYFNDYNDNGSAINRVSI